jgi:hypothetical protein
MAVSAKMAAYLKKEMKAAKGKPEEKGVKREVRAMELQNKTEVELNKIRKSGGDRGKAADFELDRREANRRSKAIGGSKEPDFEAMTGPKLRELKKYYSGEKKFEELEVCLNEVLLHDASLGEFKLESVKKIVDLLDPNGDRIPTFHIYNFYSKKC